MEVKLVFSVLTCMVMLYGAEAEEYTSTINNKADQDLKTAESSRFLNWYGGNGGYRPSPPYYANNGNGYYYGNGYNYPNPNYNPNYNPYFNTGYRNFYYPNNGFNGYPGGYGGYPGGYSSGFGNGYSTGYGGYNTFNSRYRGNEYK